MMRVSTDHTFDQVPSNRELLARYVATSDEDAFATLVERFGPMVLGVARRLLSDFEDADDAAQLAFAELARRAGTIENPDAIASWLHTVTAHIALRLRKRRPGHKALAADPVDPRLSLDRIARRSDFEVLSEELDRLPHDWREPLLLRYFSGLSNEETAVQLGTSVTAIEGRLKRGKQSLRARLLRRGVSAAAVLGAIGPAKYAHAAGEHPLNADHWSSITDSARDVATDPSNLSFAPALETTNMATPLITFKAALATGVAAVVLATLGGDGRDTASTPRVDGISTVAAAEPTSEQPTNLNIAEANKSDPFGTSGFEGSNSGVASEPARDPKAGDSGRVEPTTIIGEFGVVDGAVIASEPAADLMPVTTPDIGTSRGDSVESLLKIDAEVEFVDAPLIEFLDYLEDHYGLQVNLDETALDEVGLSGDESFTLVGRYSTLARCLDVVLQDKIGDLDFVAREDEILITTAEYAEALLSTKLYPLTLGFDTLESIEAIESHVRPDTWASTGGSGVITAAPLGNADAQLLITTSYRGHREVAEFLDMLAEATPIAEPRRVGSTRPYGGNSGVGLPGAPNIPAAAVSDPNRIVDSPAVARRPETFPTTPDAAVSSPPATPLAAVSEPNPSAGPGVELGQPARPSPQAAHQQGTSIVAYDVAKVSKLLYQPKPKAIGFEDYGSGELGGGYGGDDYGAEYGGGYGELGGMGGMSAAPSTRLITLTELGQFSGTTFKAEMVVQRGSQLLVRTDAAMHQKIRTAIDDLVKLLETAGPPEVEGETRITIPPNDDPFSGGYGGGFDDSYGGE